MEKQKSNIKNIYKINKEKLRLFKINISEEKKELLIKFTTIIIPFAVGLIILIKSILFWGQLNSRDIVSINSDYFYEYYSNIMFISQVAVIMIIISFAFLFENKKSTYLLLTIDAFLSMLFLFN